MVVTRQGFTQVVANAFAGFGLPPEGPSVYEFPMGMFNAGSDLTPINENIDKIVYGLTKWQPKITTKGIFHPNMVTVQGKDYASAIDNMNALFIKNMWSDGLPLLPPTPDRVKWILTGTDLPPDSVITKTIDPRGGIADVTSIAVALAMTGGRPEYLPVLIAAVQAISDPAFGLSSLNATTSSVIPAIIMSGPIARQIRLGSGYGLLGPDPQHPAGQIIGRAIRIILQDLGGALPGIGTMAIYGGMRTTNAVFAEDEEGLPKGWSSLAVERGFPANANVVTATPVASMVNGPITVWGTKETNISALTILAKLMAVPDSNTWSTTTPEVWASPDHATGVCLIGRGFAASLASDSGYSKLDVKTFLWNNTKLPWSEMVATGLDHWPIDIGLPKGQDVPQTARPDQIMLVVAGGDQSGHLYRMQVGVSGHTVVSQEIKLPAKAKWDALLKQAEADLGPAPAAH